MMVYTRVAEVMERINTGDAETTNRNDQRVLLRELHGQAVTSVSFPRHAMFRGLCGCADSYTLPEIDGSLSVRVAFLFSGCGELPDWDPLSGIAPYTRPTNL